MVEDLRVFCHVGFFYVRPRGRAYGRTKVFVGDSWLGSSNERERTMDNTALLVLIIVLVLLFGGGGGYFWKKIRGRN